MYMLLIGNPHLADDPVLLAVRCEGVRPEPPAAWALVSDTGQGWHLKAEARRGLSERGYDLTDYTLYAVDQRRYTGATRSGCASAVVTTTSCRWRSASRHIRSTPSARLPAGGARVRQRPDRCKSTYLGPRRAARGGPCSDFP